MKLRIRGNSVRLRLTKSEVSEFSAKGKVENKTDFGNSVFIYALKSSEKAEKLEAKFKNGKIEIIVPQAEAKDWAETEKIGISAETQNLKILIEKDFVCLTQREGEDESDNFPHPKEKEINC